MLSCCSFTIHYIIVLIKLSKNSKLFILRFDTINFSASYKPSPFEMFLCSFLNDIASGSVSGCKAGGKKFSGTSWSENGG